MDSNRGSLASEATSLPIQPLFVYFRSFLIPITNIVSIATWYLNWITYIWCLWDSNPWMSGVWKRRIHWSKAVLTNLPHKAPPMPNITDTIRQKKEELERLRCLAAASTHEHGTGCIFMTSHFQTLFESFLVVVVVGDECAQSFYNGLHGLFYYFITEICSWHFYLNLRPCLRYFLVFSCCWHWHTTGSFLPSHNPWMRRRGWILLLHGQSFKTLFNRM